MGKFNDLSGQIFGRLTVLYRDYEREKINKIKTVYYQCKCECGTIKAFSRNGLKQGTAQSCGCLQKEIASKRSLIDLTGQKFERLLVLEKSDLRTSCRGVKWICLCDCGNLHIVSGAAMKSGFSKSCGCLNMEVLKDRHDIPEYIRLSKVMLYKARANSKVRSRDFSLEEDFIFIHNMLECFYCGIQSERMGIDRIDSSIGYTMENSVPCCSMCNLAKNKIPLEEFLEYLDHLQNLKHKPSKTVIEKLTNIRKEMYE